jgi:NADPH-dependent 2,4-dienoyl-CoA reductase/sulfur reductase-like enzyme/nitrite reductase/ring-hydroxylating ferredoxin subunit
MSVDHAKCDGPDFAQGVKSAILPEGAMVAGHANGEPVLLIRRENSLFALGPTCTHYGAPLGEGLLVGETIRCPWHHACFSLRTGAVLRAPALDPLPCWRVEELNGMIYVREQLAAAPRRSSHSMPGEPASVVIVGGGCAGHAAARTLRDEGYGGKILMLSADKSLPCDRPNLSKGYLAGTASDATNLLKPAAFYEEQAIEIRLDAPVIAIDTANRHVEMQDGSRHSYGALLLATGAEPIRLDIAGTDLGHVHYLRSLEDSRAIVAAAQTAKRAVVIGASFIGLEVAASLRTRDIEVDVVGREAIPMEKILGPEVGNFLRAMHEAHGVTFHLGATASAIDERSVTLDNGEALEADLVVIGIGVRPVTALAEQAGLEIDRGVLVDEYLKTSVPGVFAAGDIARWPDRLTGERIRVEHFVVAERQGQSAARNILGRKQKFDAIPFFWTEQYDLGLAYVGHAERWDEMQVDGQIEARDCQITYLRGGKKLAVAVIHRDLEGLRAEVEFERVIACPSAARSDCADALVSEVVG